MPQRPPAVIAHAAPWPSRPRSPSSAPALVTAVLMAAQAVAGDDPFADAVILFDPGSGANPSFPDPGAALGPPERFTGEGVFPGVVSPFNPPFGTDEIVSVGAGGSLVVRFETPVTDAPDNPFGVDLIVFGNAGFIDSAFPSGIVGGLFGGDGGVIDVSADGVEWFTIAGIAPDGLFPTVGYLDSGPYDVAPGSDESDFTRPVNPAWQLSDFIGLGLEDVLKRYGGAGGGAGIDLQAVGLSAISYVRVRNPLGATGDIEIDALSDVGPALTGDVTGDGAVDVTDLIAVITQWGQAGAPADVNGDGVVDILDLVIVITSWGG